MKQRAWFPSFSLKTKMALSVAVLFVVFIMAASYFTLSYFERTFKETISADLFVQVTTLAKTIDDKLDAAHHALITVAKVAPPQAFSDVGAAQRFLDQRVGLKAIFDNGIFFIDKQGRLIAESPYRAGRRGKDLAFREWVQKTIQTARPYISEPYISTHSPGQPAIVMTVPLFDNRGNMTGMITGSLDLTGENGLAELAHTPVGRNGYLYLTDSRRTMVVHPDPTRIMKPAAAPGINRMYDQAMNGFEGSGETVTSYGIAMISSYKRLKTNAWILAANYPSTEAYAPLNRANHYFWLATSLATPLLLLLTWLIMRRLMSPLQAVARHLERLPDLPPQERPVRVASNDEIGVLASSFNTMMATLDKQQVSLRESEEKFRLLADFTVDWEYWIDPRQAIIYSSPSCFSISGYTAAEFMQDPELLKKIVHPDDRELLANHIASASDMDVDGGSPRELEFRIITKAGTECWISHVCRPIHDRNGIYRGRRASNRNITERKRIEEALHEHAVLLESEIAERQKAQEGLAAKQRQLEDLNASLEELISGKIADLRKKDQLLIHQSRLAAMGEMINNIAHQWRQPLNNLGLVIQNLGMFFEKGQLTEGQMNKACETAMNTIGYMSRTIDDFRFFFRQDKQKQQFSVDELVERTLEFVSANLKHNNILVDVQTEEQITAHGYPNEFSQVLLNIINNARDVLSEREVYQPMIHIRVLRERGACVVTIADNGGGIEAEIIPKIFDPYFSTKEQGKGSGIGLYMSKVIIEQNMGGSLSVCNNNGGAEFRIALCCDAELR